MDELLLSCYGVSIRVVDEADTGVCGLLGETFPPAFQCAGLPDLAPVSYVIAAEEQSASGELPRYTVARDGIPVVHEATIEDLVAWLGQDIDRSVAERSQQRLFVPAGVVGWRGLAIVIPGYGAAGRSSLVAELVRRGAEYYSDAFAVLDAAGRVHPYPRPLLLDEEQQPPADLRLARETSAEPLPVGLIVSGAVRPGSTWQPRVVRGARAVRPVIDQAVRAHEDAVLTAQIAEQIAPEVVMLQGSWPDAAAVAAQLLDLVEEGLMSHALGATGQGDPSLAADLAGVATLRLLPGSSRPAPTPRQLVAARSLRIPDFLPPQEHQHLLAHALACEAEFTESGIINAQGEGTLDHSFRKSRTLYGPRLEEIWGLFEERLRAILPAVRQELGLDWFPVREFERQLTAHSGGGFFAPHVDTGNPAVESRRISCVYYFHAMPQRFSGGELKLYDTWVTPTGSTAAPTCVALTPTDNSIVFFPSDALHEVSPVHPETDAFADSRFAVTMWVREDRHRA